LCTIAITSDYVRSPLKKRAIDAPTESTTHAQKGEGSTEPSTLTLVRMRSDRLGMPSSCRGGELSAHDVRRVSR